MIYKDDVAEILQVNFPHVWEDTGPLPEGLTVWRCTENQTSPYGKIASFVMYDGEEIKDYEMDEHMKIGLMIYAGALSDVNISAVDHGFFNRYGKFAKSQPISVHHVL